ncbi:ABC transporter permease [Mangrovactinospora gilvigrisea]|uniref:ABC transporter permease n=1 Tax=Mangrovactinospora gilvigrisea TaxID=1428644 RepID=A0A1J7BJM6_9ACTN|nr:sugar ABC transporter permease [Mangrovactinospora gilvigrisea]OIV38789.1 ABC transporter permease [Mangrovactinospora gilvigrisea]
MTARVHRLTKRDKVVVAVMAGIPTLLALCLVWLPAIASIVLSFTNWTGVGGLSTITFDGVDNYKQLFSINPQFWPAVEHNLIWLAALLLVGTPLGMFLAYQLDKKIRLTKFYQTAFFLPVVVSTAVIGFVWKLVYDPDNGLINSLFHTNKPGDYLDWIGSPHLNLWAVLVAAIWRHAGYLMVLYLAGLKSVDPSLKEAAALDGAGGWQAFRHVVFPVLKPINIVVLVVTIIEALRAFDIVWVFNKGAQGTELLSILITQNIVGEASRIGYGSAIAVVLMVISLGAIIPYLWVTFRRERREGNGR